MVSAERQFKLACDLAEQDPYSHIAFVCTRVLFGALAASVAGGVFNKQTMRVVFPNGGTVTCVSQNSEDFSYLMAGYQFTAVFHTPGHSMSFKNQQFLHSRLRSSKYHGPLKVYYPDGYATWVQVEAYE